MTGVSDWISNEARRTFLQKAHVVTIHNGVDLQVFKPRPSDLRERLGLQGKYVILGPASKWLLPVNRQVLIDFVHQMKEDEVLLLFGVWSDRQKNYLHTLGLTEKVLTYGFTHNRQELAELYSFADVFANTSREDTLPFINLEAQACGTPVVTFDQTGPKETVDEENSFSVQAGNATELYEAVRKIRAGETSETPTRCRHFVEQMFDLNKTYPLYMNLYKVCSKN